MRFLLLVLFLGFTFNQTLKAGSETREIMKVIAQYPSLKMFPRNEGDASVFWKFITSRNRSLNRYLAKDSHLQKNIQLQMASDMKKLSIDFEMMSDLFNAQATQNIISKMCGTRIGISRILKDDLESFNAGMYPNGVMLVGDDLLNELTKEELMGVFAHELAHFYLRHSEVNRYRAIKRGRRNAVIAGLEAVAVAGSDVYAKGNGVKTDQQQTEKNIDNLFLVANDNTLRHYLKYSRIQEMEADFVACCFLDWVGIGRKHYVSALKKILKHSYSNSDDKYYSTHPDIKDRIYISSIFWDIKEDEWFRLAERDVLSLLPSVDQQVYQIIKNNQGMEFCYLPIGELSLDVVSKSIRRLVNKNIVDKEGGGGRECYYLNVDFLLGSDKSRRKANNEDPLYD